MRLFIGIPLGTSTVAELATISRELGTGISGLRWPAPETLHITLQFLGNSTPEQCACVVARLQTQRSQPVPVQLGDVGFFDRAGIFFGGVLLTPELISLQHHVAAATTLCGFVPETRPYRPHITLARAKGNAGAQGLRELKRKIVKQPSFTAFVAEEFLLYESFTHPTGSLYEIRERFSLN